MKTQDFDSLSSIQTGYGKSQRRAPAGMGVGSALLGLACGAGVFAVLALLYHFG